LKPIDLHPVARREWESSVAFYSRIDKKLASDFNLRVWNALREIACYPYRFPLAHDMYPLQKFTLGRFPFTILYINYPNRIWVVAVAHGSRQPGFWKKRT